MKDIQFFTPDMSGVLTCRLGLLDVPWIGHAQSGPNPLPRGPDSDPRGYSASDLPLCTTLRLSAHLQKQGLVARDAELAPSPPSSWLSRYRQRRALVASLTEGPPFQRQTRFLLAGPHFVSTARAGEFCIGKAVTGSRKGTPDDDATDAPMRFCIAGESTLGGSSFVEREKHDGGEVGGVSGQ